MPARLTTLASRPGTRPLTRAALLVPPHLALPPLEQCYLRAMPRLTRGVMVLLGVSCTAGCTTKTGTPAEESPPPTPVTWHQDVAPLVAANCAGCHTDTGIAPFSLTDYDSAAPFASLMADATSAGTMPPFLAQDTEVCQVSHPWKDDLRLTASELELLQAWADQGAPEGDPETAAPLPTPPDLELENPDITLPITSAVNVEGSADRFVCFSIPLNNSSLQFLQGVQINPGNEAIVHHVLVFADETGASAELAGEDGSYECFGGPGFNDAALVAAWAPGALPSEMPEGVGLAIQPNTRLVVNIHYHPTGAGVETDDSTSVALRWYQGLPEWVGVLRLIGNFSGNIGGGYGLQPGPNDDNGLEFRIPAGVSDHTETMLFPLPSGIPNDTHIWQMATHLHYVGTEMLIGLLRQDPAEDELEQECLIHTPEWDFNWQRGYLFDGPMETLPTAKAGDLIYLECTYDNTMGNPHVAAALAGQGLDAPVDVFLGEETLDEMCLGVFGLAFPISEFF